MASSGMCSDTCRLAACMRSSRVNRVTIETGLRTAEGIVARVDPIAAALPWRRSQVRAGLAAGSKLDSSSRSPGHGELGCRVILLGCVEGVGALETADPPAGGP